MKKQFKYRIDYIAAWLNAASEQFLHDNGVIKRVHLTTFFDGYGQLASVEPFPWSGPKSARIASIEEWTIGTVVHVIAVMADCPWTQEINNFFHEQGVREDNAHKPHLTLAKRVAPGAAAQFQHLVGSVLWFDRHGGEIDDRPPLEVEGDLVLRGWKFERKNEAVIKVTSPPRKSGIRVELWACKHDPNPGFYALAEDMLHALKIAPVETAEAIVIGSPDVSEFKVDVFRPGGGGGWIVKPDTCVRVTHLPTGLYAESRDERSQHANKAIAMQTLLPMVAAARTAERNGHVLLSHITDLANLPSDQLGKFIEDLPGMVAALKLAKQGADQCGTTLRAVMPLLRYSAATDSVVINHAGESHEFQNTDLVNAASRLNL
jgi:RF-1 domain